MTRREFLAASMAMAIPLRIPAPPAKGAKVAIITDLHHGLAPDAMVRLRAFVDAVRKRKDLDAVLQLGDFCYSDAGSKECLELWKEIEVPTIHVLGNHDMDKCGKDAAMKAWGMSSRFGSRSFGGYRFIWLDLNHFKKNGELVSYRDGNYFTDNASHNWADPEQLAWLKHELSPPLEGRAVSEANRGGVRPPTSPEPVVILSHQPLGIPNSDGKLPAEQQEILDILKDSPAAVSIFGHLHVDRLETADRMPCLCVNSASYFWSAGMHAYTKPLFAFAEFTAEGILKIEGQSGEFLKPPPQTSDSVKGRSAAIQDRKITCRRGS